MKINYIIEYTSKETNKFCRANLGYNINFVQAAIFSHFQKGDSNIAVLPILEDCQADDIDNINIIDVEVAEVEEAKSEE